MTQFPILHRRAALSLLAAVLCPPGLRAAPDGAALERFLARARAAASEAGIARETVDRETAGLTLDPALLARAAAQGEFSLTPRAYLARLVDGRVAAGQARLARERAALDAVERRFGVPREIVAALWGLESGYGAAQGDHDVLRSLATLGAAQPERALFETEFVAALAILDRGEATRARLLGSWAGAMGQPQFMPSSYLRHATPLSGDGPPDIWRSAGDSLASIGNFMRGSGWVQGLPAVIEVKIPSAFDWAPTDLDLAQWRALGFAPARGGILPQGGQANLFLPAGANGPALLLTANFEAIRAYNTSDAYALAVFVLAERIAGRPGLVTPWPADEGALGGSGRREVQERLLAAGHYRGAVDGRLGRATRLAVHAFQIASGVRPADGFASAALLDRLRVR